MKTKFLCLIFAALMLVGGAAQAAPVLNVLGGTPDNLQPPLTDTPFDLTGSTGIVAGAPIQIFNNSTIGPFGLDLSEAANITFEYLGADAGFANTFQVGGGDIFANSGGGASTIGDTFSTAMGSGPVDFTLISNGLAAAVNGGPIASPLAYAISVISETSVIVLFDDGGLGTDFDDFAVKISVSEVPLPAAAWLLISAILGLVSFSRIRRNGAQTA